MYKLEDFIAQVEATDPLFVKILSASVVIVAEMADDNYLNPEEVAGMWSLSNQPAEWCIDIEKGVLLGNWYTHTSGLPRLHQPYKRYFHSEYFPPSDKHWANCEAEIRAEVLTQHGSFKKACITYAIGDYRRFMSFGETWNYVNVSVTVFARGQDILHDSTGAVESDSGDDYFKMIAEEMIPSNEDIVKAIQAKIDKSFNLVHELSAAAGELK